jgi:hypothetical protein
MKVGNMQSAGFAVLGTCCIMLLVMCGYLVVLKDLGRKYEYERSLYCLRGCGEDVKEIDGSMRQWHLGTERKISFSSCVTKVFKGTLK